MLVGYQIVCVPWVGVLNVCIVLVGRVGKYGYRYYWLWPIVTIDLCSLCLYGLVSFACLLGYLYLASVGLHRWIVSAEWDL